MATAKMVQGMLPGVDRPALAAAFPTLGGRAAVMLDVGANVDCTAKMLAQFAVMGNAYSRVIFYNKTRASAFCQSARKNTRATLLHTKPSRF